MCVRELRTTEAPNVIVFYLAFISSLGALTGIMGQVRCLSQSVRYTVAQRKVSILLGAVPRAVACTFDERGDS